MNYKLKMILAATLTTMMATACGADDKDPNDGNNATDDYERPQGARDIISDEQLRRFEDAGAIVHGGDSPPTIAASFYFGDAEVRFTDSERWPPAGSTNWCHRIITYEPGETSETYNSSVTYPNCEGEGQGMANFISGKGDCFTLYQKESGTFYGCESETISIMSACLNSDGDMENPLTASMNTMVAESPECDTIIGEGRDLAQGEISVVGQADGRAERVN